MRAVFAVRVDGGFAFPDACGFRGTPALVREDFLIGGPREGGGRGEDLEVVANLERKLPRNDRVTA